MKNERKIKEKNQLNINQIYGVKKMSLWFNEPAFVIIISISLIIVFLVYNMLIWSKRKKSGATSDKNLNQFYLDLIILAIISSLLIIPMFFLL